jgi:pimeloyl-ACP methyl ester carboxylesterase
MMHVEVHAGTGPYLLLVHGICSSRAQWRPNLAGLAAFSRPVVVELLGHGRSQSPAEDAAYAVGAYLARFETIRADLGAERWAICGQSFGAGLTLNYALERPERILGQVFTNSNSALAKRNPAITDEMRLARLAGFETRGRTALEAMPFFPKRSGRLAPGVEDELLGDTALISLEGFAQGLRYTAPGLSVIDRFAETKVPTLLVNGRREKSFQPVRDEAARLLPALQVVDLDGGHPINLDRPEAFNAAVRAFLAGR